MDNTDNCKIIDEECLLKSLEKKAFDLNAVLVKLPRHIEYGWCPSDCPLLKSITKENGERQYWCAAQLAIESQGYGRDIQPGPKCPVNSYLSEYIMNEDRYNDDGYDHDGYNRDGYDRAGYDHDGYDRDGYDRKGYNRSGYDRCGYDRERYDRSGYDRGGYDRCGYDCCGYDRGGYDRIGNERW